jgi:hypothetical protein
LETGVSRAKHDGNADRGQVAVGYGSAGYWTIIDGIIISGWFFEPLRDSIGASGFDVAYAVLRPPLALAVERAASRRSSLWGA